MPTSDTCSLYPEHFWHRTHLMFHSDVFRSFNGTLDLALWCKLDCRKVSKSLTLDVETWPSQNLDPCMGSNDWKHNSSACYPGSLHSVWSLRRFHTHPEHVWERFLADKLYDVSQHSIRICGASLILRNVWCNCRGARDSPISSVRNIVCATDVFTILLVACCPLAEVSSVLGRSTPNDFALHTSPR